MSKVAASYLIINNICKATPNTSGRFQKQDLVLMTLLFDDILKKTVRSKFSRVDYR
ncbi:hypothetical protein S7335_2991 [Synechococcus sp. PCC 7335]|nr:hypothetical protein S7335_2991 [Synechococcus sp. PCC 7335]